MGGRECREIDRVEAIAARDEEDIVVGKQRRLTLAGAAGRAQQLLLDRILDRNPVGGAITEHLHDRLRTMVEVDHGTRATGGRDPAEEVLHDGTIADRCDRLREVVCQRTQSRPESGSHDHYAHPRRVAGQW